MIERETRRVPMLPAPSVSQTAELRREVHRLKTRERAILQRVLCREEIGRIITAVLEDEGVPAELAGLALIESGLNPQAKSRSGAVGAWQFMKGTARRYGLRVDFFEDHRQDPVLATIAAARMLRELYARYKDWLLTLAAYNAGSGRVSHDIARAGTRDYWELSRRGYLTGETRRFVPRVLAAILLLQSPESFGLSRTSDGEFCATSRR